MKISVSYTHLAVSGTEVAAVLGQDPKRVFKTLVTVAKSGNHYVFVIPVEKELDLKKAAKAVGEKSIDMVKSKELLGLTGYILSLIHIYVYNRQLLQRTVLLHLYRLSMCLPMT